MCLLVDKGLNFIADQPTTFKPSVYQLLKFASDKSTDVACECLQSMYHTQSYRTVRLSRCQTNTMTPHKFRAITCSYQHNTKCSTPNATRSKCNVQCMMLLTSVVGRAHGRPCYPNSCPSVCCTSSSTASLLNRIRTVKSHNRKFTE